MLHGASPAPVAWCFRMLDAFHIAALQHAATAQWHGPEPEPDSEPSGSVKASHAAEPGNAATLESLVLAQHRANFELWHQEDAARDPAADDRIIAAVKHAIDTLNQRRNDLVERIDELLLSVLQQRPEAPLHSETPGLIIDRLSILSLKIHHTEEETVRAGTSEEHKARNRSRLDVLANQRTDLALCLAQLWSELGTGHRRFKLYRQMKMYNDPTLNPVLYSKIAPPGPSRREGGEAAELPPADGGIDPEAWLAL